MSTDAFGSSSFLSTARTETSKSDLRAAKKRELQDATKIEKPQVYLVTVRIIEGRHYAITNMDSCVIVKVGNKSKRTKVVANADNPYYNEYFVFEYNLPLSKLLDMAVSFTVIQPQKVCTARKVLGNFVLDVGTIWAQNNHLFYHKWAVIRNKGSKKGVKPGVNGYLSLDLALVGKGYTPKFPAVEYDNQAIEGHLLLPEGITMDRQPASFIFSIYKAEALLTSERNICGRKDETMPSTYVKITFAGLTGQTVTKSQSRFPEWFTRITLNEMFPPMVQRIKIDLCFKSGTVVTQYLDMKSISNHGEKGFLPTFGPDYLQFYTKQPDIRYAGRLFMEMQTILFDERKNHKTNVVINQIGFNHQLVSPWADNKFFLFCAIYSVTMIDKKFKDNTVYFGMAIGDEENVTDKYVPMADSSKKVFYIDFNDAKPCLSITSTWPDSRIRHHRANELKRIYQDLKTSMDKIEQQLDSIRGTEDFLKEIKKINIKAIVDKLTNSLDLFYCKTKGSKNMGTDLDKKRLIFTFEEIFEIQKRVKKIKRNELRKPQKSLKKLFKILKMLQNLIYEDLTYWPDVFLNMHYENRKVGWFRVAPREIMHSHYVAETGQLCGKIISIDLKKVERTRPINKRSELACRMYVQFWLGPFEIKEKHLQRLSQQYFLKPSGMPEFLTPRGKNIFECRVYILEGKFIPGSDNTGLADPFARVILGEEIRETKILDKTLYPIWDETLVFQKIVLDGSTSYVSENPPLINVEIFDKDVCGIEKFGVASFYPKFVGKKSTWKSKLEWHPVFTINKDLVGEILASAEIESVDKRVTFSKPNAMAIPNDIRPRKTKYRMDVLFWGVRKLKPGRVCPITKPRMTIECGLSQLVSSTISNAKNFSNFTPQTQHLDLELPMDVEYIPTIAIKLFESRTFGRYSFIGVNMQNPRHCLYEPLTWEDRERILREEVRVVSVGESESEESGDGFGIDNEDERYIKLKYKYLEKYSNSATKTLKHSLSEAFRKLTTNRKRKVVMEAENYLYMKSVDVRTIDWWTKFYNSLQDLEEKVENHATCRPIRLKIYPNELENQYEFNSFSDQIRSYKMYRGKRSGDELLDDVDVVGIFKGFVRIYKWTPEMSYSKYITHEGYSIKDGLYQHLPDNSLAMFIARIYVIRALNIRPMDWNGNSDPYVGICLSGTMTYDKNHAATNQVNPIFGRCYEITGNFPNDTILTVSVWDKELLTKDELIGETKIDLEKRMYTKHRAKCGLPTEYIETGGCQWRDAQKPAKILGDLCRRSRLDAPIFIDDSVKIGPCIFTIDKEMTGSKEEVKEKLALMVLRRWSEIPLIGCHLVPEHVETRSLYHPDKPGIEQGKLQLWIDIFDSNDFPMPPAVNVTPHLPKEYELRVIVWNTEDVFLQEDDFFIGQKKSDIYIKAWTYDPDDSQRTDVHYNSITGEGNFNWRFVFNFSYLAAENKIIVYKTESIFSNDKTEHKYPCKLTLQVWDNDTFSADDFIGTLELDLARMPRGAKTSKACKLQQVTQTEGNTINLFKIKRHKGWWPFRTLNMHTNKMIMTGKLEAEMELYTKKEAEGRPAGLGREPPQTLPPPNRPDISFAWFMNPLKLCKYTLKAHKYKICICCMLWLIIIFILLTIYAMPSELAKKILHIS